MPNLAILIGNTDYLSLNRLDCCRDDVLAMRALLAATDKYSNIEMIENAEADDLKTRIRAAIDKAQSPTELFFYYTGHGYQREDEFYYCATNFDPNRPNETGISTTELHTLLRLAEADLVVKVIDACNSGSLLMKADSIIPQHKQGFKNLIQISSCLDSQTSLTGNPLSLFTEEFRAAVLRKVEGVVFYTDVINALRDAFINNDSQTPFFVSQVTGREQFVDDARRFDKLRATLNPAPAVAVDSNGADAQLVSPPATALQLLEAWEASVVKPDLIEAFVGTFFDNLKAKTSMSEFADYFDLEFTEHSDFEEETSRVFIIRVLSREKRNDNFVTASISRKYRHRNPWDLGISSFLTSQWTDDDDIIETHDLSLNCSMPRAQLCVTLTPKFSAFQRIVLVVTCAPSLETCYVFEVATQHMLRDFGKFDDEGRELVRRWYRFKWTDSTDFVVAKISSKLAEIVRAHVESTIKRLGEEKSTTQEP